MSMFSSLTQQYRTRLLAALRRGRVRRGRTSMEMTPASEALEDRALLSAVSYTEANDLIVFNADADEQNVVVVSSPDADTLVIRSQQLVGGLVQDDPITLESDAIGNAGFTLDATGTILTVAINELGSTVDSVIINTFEEDDQILALSSPATVSIDANGGGGSDTFEAGFGFRMDTLFGDFNFDGGVGTDSMELMDFESTVSDTITLTNTAVTGIAPGDFGYANVENLSFDTADLVPVTLNILSTNADTDTLADLTFADANSVPVLATVTVGNTAANFRSTDGNMTPFQGDVELETQSGALTLNLDDGGDASGDTVTIDGTSVSGFSAGTLSFTTNTTFEAFNVEAGTGDDVIDATNGSASIEFDGGDGNDQITGTDNADTLLGGAGNDTLDGNGGDDFIDGDVGDDSLLGGDGDDEILGFTGSDFVEGGEGNDQISGEADEDTLDGGLGDDSVDGGDGNDTVIGNEGNDTLLGGFANDHVMGNAGDDLLLGGDGEDTLEGNGGSDSLVGGLGVDTIRGGAGKDVISWELIDGDDDVDGGTPTGTGEGGFDTQVVFGTLGDDVFTVGLDDGETVVQSGAFQLTIGESIEELEIVALSGDDELDINEINGDVEKVIVRGDAGADRIDARGLASARALLIGGAGGDVIYGGQLGDSLRGGAGADTLDGGTGDDSIKGSSGRDRMLWRMGDGSDLYEGGKQADVLIVDGDSNANDVAMNHGVEGTMLSIDGATQTLDEVESLSLRTFEGADNVVAGTLTGTDLRKVVANLAQGPDTFDMSGIGANVQARVMAGTGNDVVLGGPADDFLRGSSDKDFLNGGGGNDELDGDSGDDTITGGTGNDVIRGDDGDDLLMGKDGNDLIQAGGGADRVEADAGDDTIFGASGKDRILAGEGDDLVDAGQGSDNVDGGEGNDVLIGGTGSDTIFGRGGQDLLVAGSVDLSGNAMDRIRDEWLADRQYDDRVENITGVKDGKVLSDSKKDPARLNGNNELLPITGDRTVDDDEMVDSLVGNAGRDLFFADFDTDMVVDRVPSETVIDLR